MSESPRSKNGRIERESVSAPFFGYRKSQEDFFQKRGPRGDAVGVKRASPKGADLLETPPVLQEPKRASQMAPPDWSATITAKRGLGRGAAGRKIELGKQRAPSEIHSPSGDEAGVWGVKPPCIK